MKKRLLFAFVAMCVAVSGFALTKNEFVYTPQGRFQIIGDNLNANNAFQTMDGWTAIGEGKTLADLFNTNADGLSAGFNSVVSTAATADEGMYFKFEPTDANATYVVSFKMKGAALNTTRVRVPTDYVVNENVVKVEGNTDGAYAGTTEVLLCNTAEELTENWQTFNYAIKGDGTARTYFISFVSMATTIEIADLQIAPAMQFADLRQRDAMLNKLNAYKNCYKWSEDLLNEYSMTETIANLEALGDEAGQADLDDLLSTAQEVLDEFLKANMDDYLPTVEVTATTNGSGTPKVDVKFSQWFAKVQKAITWGDWNCLPSGRGFWEKEEQGAADFGHYAGSYGWCANEVDKPMGVYMNKTLDPGSYVFGVEGSAAFREGNTSKSWTNNDGMNPAYGVAYIGKATMNEEGEYVIAPTDTIARQVLDLDAVDYTQFLVSAKIEEEGTYQIGYLAYCKDAYKELKNGCVAYIKNASIWGKNANKYNQKQLGYEADVREQIQAGHDNITKAVGYLDNAEYFWGKAELQACLDSVETKIEKYDALDQDAIIATYEEDYAKSTSEETGYLVYEIYQELVRDIIAANKKFVAVNDTLNSIQTVIDNAEATMALRLYSAAAGKADLQAAIDAAKALQAQMKAAQYSEENAATIVAANVTLNEAIDAFKASIPASAIATLVDIGFENAAVLNEATGLYGVAGAAGTMEFSAFSTVDAPVDGVFEQGLWSNGEQKWAGYLRVGNGTGTVEFDPTVNGSMGSDILKVNCDFFIQGLSNRSVGFYLKDAEDVEVSGVYRNYYQGTSTYNPFGDGVVAKVWAKSGGTYDDASPAGVEDATANPLQKTSFEIVMDYGTNKMYCTISSINGTATSEEIDFTGVPVKYILQCDYDTKFGTRRAWFDNLKIQRISTEGGVDGIVEVNPDAKVVAPTKVLKNGRIVINGKYGVNGMIIK